MIEEIFKKLKPVSTSLGYSASETLRGSNMSSSEKSGLISLATLPRSVSGFFPGKQQTCNSEFVPLGLKVLKEIHGISYSAWDRADPLLYILMGTEAYSCSLEFSQLLMDNIGLISSDTVKLMGQPWSTNYAGVLAALNIACSEYELDCLEGSTGVMKLNKLKPSAKKAVRNIFFLAKRSWLCSPDQLVPGMITNLVDWDSEDYYSEDYFSNLVIPEVKGTNMSKESLAADQLW